MWELDHKQGWVPKNLYSWIIKLEKTLESPLNFKKIKPVYSKENQLWIVIGKTVTKAEVPVLWPPDAKNRLIEKYPDAGKNWRQEERGTIEDEMVGWHHQFNGYEFEQALRDGEGQVSLAYCSPWGRKESDTSEQLNWTDRFIDYNKCTTTSLKFQCCVIFLVNSHLISESLFMNILEHINHQLSVSSVMKLCPTLWDPMDCSTRGFPVHHQLPEFTQNHLHWVCYAIWPSHPLPSPSPPAFNFSQHQGIFKWVSSLHQVTKVLEFQL